MINRKSLPVVVIALLCCGAMALVDGVIRPGYAVKSAIKIALFLLLPYLLSRFDREAEFGKVFRFHRRGFFAALALGAGLYGLILGGYLLLRSYIDFSGIVDSLSANAGVNKGNFLFVSLYISFINSLLEEFFFRGFLFTNLKKSAPRPFAWWFSSAVFALYHVAMMIGWFHPLLLLLVIAGLTAGGMIFNYLNEKLNTLFGSWIVHMFANFAINTIGFLLMG